MILTGSRTFLPGRSSNDELLPVIGPNTCSGFVGAWTGRVFDHWAFVHGAAVSGIKVRGLVFLAHCEEVRNRTKYDREGVINIISTAWSRSFFVSYVVYEAT